MPLVIYRDLPSGLRKLELDSSEIDVLVVDGVAFSADFFRFFGDHASTGTVFRFELLKDGQVTVRRFAPGSTVQEPS